MCNWKNPKSSKSKLFSFIFFFIIGCCIIFLLSNSAYPWGSLKSPMYNTHEWINRAAYDALKSSTFLHKNFPDLNQINFYEGIEKYPGEVPRGAGPDSEGSTKYSEHYYNPRTGKGGAPSSVKNHFTVLALRLQKKDTASAAQSVAWAAHFLADMFVPYHVVGIPASEARTIASRKKPGIPIILNTGRAGEIEVLGSGYVIGGTSKNMDGDFTDEINRFLTAYKSASHMDWFDPWYWNGWTYMEGTSSTHLGWETWAHNQISGITYSFSGFYPHFKNAIPSFITPIKNQAEQIEEMTKSAASETVSETKDYINNPDKAMNRAITAVLTMWRASYSALEPEFKIVKRDNKYLVEGAIKNNEHSEDVKDVKIKLEVENGELDKVINVGKITAGGTSAKLTIEIGSDYKGKEDITVKVIGNFDKTPDLQYAEQRLKYEQADKQKHRGVAIMSPLNPKSDNYQTDVHIRNYLGQVKGINVILEPRTVEEFFELLAKYTKDNKKIDYLIIAGHGSCGLPHISLFSAEELILEDVNIHLIQSQIKQKINKIEHDKKEICNQIFNKDSKGNNVHDIESLENRIESNLDEVKKLKKRLELLEKVQDVMAENAKILLLNCSALCDEKGREFVMNLAKILLWKRGGFITASENDIKIGMGGYFIPTPDFIRDFVGYYKLGEYFLKAKWVTLNITPENLAPFDKSLVVKIEPPCQEVYSGNKAKFEALVETLHDSGKLSFQWDDKCYNSKSSICEVEAMHELSNKIIAITNRVIDEKGREGSVTAYLKIQEKYEIDIEILDKEFSKGSTIKAKALSKFSKPSKDSYWAWRTEGNIKILERLSAGEEVIVEIGGDGKLILFLYEIGLFGKEKILATAIKVIKPKMPCKYEYSEWSKCDTKTKKQIRKLISKSPEGCIEKEKPEVERDCKPEEDTNKQKSDKLWNDCIELARVKQFKEALQKCEESLTYWSDEKRRNAVIQLREQVRKEQLAQLEKEREERERIERERREREKAERERIERERLEKERREREEQERIEQEKRERERRESEKKEEDKKKVEEAPTCSYEYSNWGECSRATKTQKRTVIAKKPEGCEERQKPVLEQGCTPPLRTFSQLTKDERNNLLSCLCNCSCGGPACRYVPPCDKDPGGVLACPCVGMPPCQWGEWGCNYTYFKTTGECIENCFKNHYVVFNALESERDIRDENRKHMKPLKVKISPDTRPIKAQYGDVVTLKAEVQGGMPSYAFKWSGDGMGKDGEFIFAKARKAGSYPVSVTVTDSDGNTATASTTIVVEAMKVKLTMESPKEKTLPIGSKANLMAEVLSGDKHASGTFYYQWQPHPEVVFGDPKNLVPETTGGAQSRNTALFKRTGNFKIWVDVFKEIEGRKVKVGESEQIPINVVNSKLNLKVSKTDPLVGDKVVVTVQEEPKMSDEFVSFWWEYSGNIDNPGVEPNIPNSRAYSFKPKDTKPVTITVHGKAKDGGDDLGEAKTTITAKSYQVSISQPRYLGPKPRIWKCDTQLGGACPGLVEVADTQFAVFRDIFMKATVTPTPESPRYRWSIDPSGSCGFPGAGDEIKLNCSQTGTYTVKVEVTNADGVKLGEATQTVTVSISDEMLKQADKSKQAYDKVQQAKQLVGQGKLDEGINIAQEAVSLDPKNQEVKSLSDKWTRERDSINRNIDNANKLINEKKFADAEKELSQAKALHPKYAKVLEAEKRLNEERNKKQRADQLWNECIALTKQNRHAEALGKCKESLNISPDERRRQAVAQLEQESGKKQKADELWNQCINLAKANRLDEAINRCEQSLSYWSSEDRQRAYGQMKNTFQETKEDNQNKKVADRLWNECIELARQKNYEQAWRKCDESLKYWKNDQRIEATAKLKEEARRVASSTTQPPFPPPLPPVSTEPPVRDYTYQSSTTTAKSQVIFNNGNIAGVYNNPTRPTVFTINQPYAITLIQNYHWNNARGSTPGTIALRDQSGRTYGPWKAQGSPGQGGVPNAYWTVYPNITLPAGTYTVIDSEPSTWAQNSGSGGAGHTRVEGYPSSERVNQQGTVNVQQGGTINNVQSGATLNAEITNASRENVHIFIEGQDTFGPHNRVTPGERKTVSIKAPVQAGFINFIAGRNGQVLAKCRWEYVPDYQNRVPVVRFSDPNILSCSTGIR